MADFWIKLEKNTPDKPEIFEMAEILSIDPDAVLGKLIRVWCWVDSNSADGHIKSVTPVLIDRLTMSQGFADAMTSVGWLEENSIPNFARHLGESAKKRAKDSERKRMSRTTSAECPKESVTESGLDKSRVDKNKKEGEKTPLKEKESKIPPCPHSEIINIYHKVLPELQSVNESLWKGSQREKDLSARWKQNEEFRKREFWEWLFTCIKNTPFDMGENDRNWRVDLGWLLKKENFIKRVEKFSS